MSETAAAKRVTNGPTDGYRTDAGTPRPSNPPASEPKPSSEPKTPAPEPKLASEPKIPTRPPADPRAQRGPWDRIATPPRKLPATVPAGIRAALPTGAFETIARTLADGLREVGAFLDAKEAAETAPNAGRTDAGRRAHGRVMDAVCGAVGAAERVSDGAAGAGAPVEGRKTDDDRQRAEQAAEGTGTVADDGVDDVRPVVRTRPTSADASPRTPAAHQPSNRPAPPTERAPARCRQQPTPAGSDSHSTDDGDASYVPSASPSGANPRARATAGGSGVVARRTRSARRRARRRQAGLERRGMPASTGLRSAPAPAAPDVSRRSKPPRTGGGCPAPAARVRAGPLARLGE